MSWDLSSEEVIVQRLEGQQQTIFTFSRKIKELEEKSAESQAQYKELLDNYYQLDKEAYDTVMKLNLANAEKYFLTRDVKVWRAIALVMTVLFLVIGIVAWKAL